MSTYPHCGSERPVAVRAYRRFRYNRWENVISHCRSLPSR